MTNTRNRWLIPLSCGALTPVLVWLIFFRDPLVGNTGVHMSEVRAGAKAMGESPDDMIAISEISDRVGKARHLTPEDWQRLQGFLHSKNPTLKEDAQHIAAYANNPEYRDTMIQVAQQSLLDPQTPDNVQMTALDLLWRKDAPGWQDEVRRLQVVVSTNPKAHQMVAEELTHIRAHQRQD